MRCAGSCGSVRATLATASHSQRPPWAPGACHMLILKADSDWTQPVTLNKLSAASPVLLILVVKAQACTLRSDTRNRGQLKAFATRKVVERTCLDLENREIAAQTLHFRYL